MSVRATERLIGEIVTATGLSNSPRMIVQAVSIEEKLITAVWFSDCHEFQQGLFPASALDKAEAVQAPVKKAKAADRKSGR
jgi:hypothetical protein